MMDFDLMSAEGTESQGTESSQQISHHRRQVVFSVSFSLMRITLLLSIVLFWWIDNSSASLSVVQSRTAAAGTSTTSYPLAYSQNVTAGNLVVVIVDGYATSLPSASITDSQGNTYQAADNMYNAFGSGAYVWSQVFWTTAQSSGANTVTATFSGSTYPAIALYEVASSSGGTWSVGPKQGTSNGTTGTSTMTVGSVTTTSTSSFIVSYIASANGTVAGGTGWTFTPGVNFPLGGAEGAAEYQIGAAGTYTGTFTNSASNGFAGGVVAFTRSGGSADDTPKADYARCLAFMTSTAMGCSGAPITGSYTTQAQMQTWLAGKVSIAEDSTGTPGITSNNKTPMSVTNPSIGWWMYAVDMTCIIGSNIPVTGCDDKGYVEDDFLHTSSTHNSGTRLTGTVFGSNRYYLNIHRSATRAVNIARLKDLAVSRGVNYIWLDEHGHNWAESTSGSNNVDEYGGTVTASEAAYHADTVTQDAELKASLATSGIGLIINMAGNTTSFSDEYTTTGNLGIGMTTEAAWSPNGMRQNFFSWIPLINTVASNGGVVDTLYDQQPGSFATRATFNDGQSTPDGSNFTAPCFASDCDLERAMMWKLAAYLLVKQANVYFDLNMDWSASNPIDNQYWPIYDTQGLGEPLAAPTSTPALGGPDATDTTNVGTNTCPDGPTVYPYVWGRAFQNGVVYVRPRDRYDCIPNGLGVTITLSEPMRLLRWDGSLGSPQSTVTIYMNDAVIMRK